MKISSIESVSLLIEMSVGVAEGGTRVIGTGVRVAVGGSDVNVGGKEVGVDKTSTEKLQASSNSALNKIITVNNCFWCFIAFSLFALWIGWASTMNHPKRNPSLEFQIGL